MAKKEDKRLGDDPFERFLPQIQDSRKKKDDDASAVESVSATESKNKSADNGTSKSESKNTSTRTSKITSKSNDISDDKSKSASNGTSESESADADEIASKSKTTITSNITSESAYESDGAAAIKIARKNKNAGYVKMTHYFRPDQLEAIETLHKESGRDKSELVRLALDILIRQAKVE